MKPDLKHEMKKIKKKTIHNSKQLQENSLQSSFLKLILYFSKKKKNVYYKYSFICTNNFLLFKANAWLFFAKIGHIQFDSQETTLNSKMKTPINLIHRKQVKANGQHVE